MFLAKFCPSLPIIWKLFWLHTDQYLQWDSHHHLSAKFSVIQTLSHRASTMCSNPELLQKEKGAPQESSHQMQLPKMGFGQGGEKTQQVFQTG